MKWAEWNLKGCVLLIFMSPGLNIRPDIWKPHEYWIQNWLCIREFSKLKEQPAKAIIMFIVLSLYYFLFKFFTGI